MSLITDQSLKAIPGILTASLSNLGSVVSSLQNLQNVNPQAFQQFQGEISSLLKGFDSNSNINNALSSISSTTAPLAETNISPNNILSVADNVAQASSTVDNINVAGGSVTPPSSTRASVQAAKEQYSKAGSIAVWPSYLGKYWFMMGFRKYQFSSRLGGGFLGGGYSPIQGPLAGAIMFPIPQNLQDATNIAYTDFHPGTELTAAAAQTIIGAVGGGLVGGTGTKAAQTALGGGKGAARQGGIAGAIQGAMSGIEQGISTGAKIASAYKGVAINPATTLLMQGPMLKEHQFQWELSPNTEEDSTKLQQILNMIKMNISPSLGLGGFILNYPMMVECYLYNEDQLYAFKPAMVTSFVVNYSPSGSPAFYKSKFPVEVAVAMQIKELEAWLAEDYAQVQ